MAELGQLDAARAIFEKIVTGYTDLCGETHYNTLVARKNVALTMVSCQPRHLYR